MPDTLDKIIQGATSLVENAGEKLEKLSDKVVEKANNFIEDSKDKIEIAKESTKIDEYTLEIGKVIVSLLDSGESTSNTKIAEFYNSIKKSRKTIEEIKNK